MAFGARTSFLPNTDMLTNVGGAGEQLDALGGDFGFEDMYEWIGRLRADKERMRRDATRWDDWRARMADQRDRRRFQIESPQAPSSLTDMAGAEENRARIAQARAQYGTPGFGGAPLRQVSGPQIVTGLTPDTIRMTGAQRRMFLPAEAEDSLTRRRG